jgi:AAA ATPase domain
MIIDTSGLSLVGRESELAVITDFLVRAARGGGTLRLHGEPGIGKTALLDAAVSTTSAASTRVVRAEGVEHASSTISSGLNQVRLPLSGAARHLQDRLLAAVPGRRPCRDHAGRGLPNSRHPQPRANAIAERFSRSRTCWVVHAPVGISTLRRECLDPGSGGVGGSAAAMLVVPARRSAAWLAPRVGPSAGDETGVYC